MGERITECLGCGLPLYLEREIDRPRKFAHRQPPIEIYLETLGVEGMRRFCAKFRDFPAFCSM
jgi:hypothetical protein